MRASGRVSARQVPPGTEAKQRELANEEMRQSGGKDVVSVPVPVDNIILLFLLLLIIIRCETAGKNGMPKGPQQPVILIILPYPEDCRRI
jgi:hypothetical protein